MSKCFGGIIITAEKPMKSKLLRVSYTFLQQNSPYPLHNAVENVRAEDPHMYNNHMFLVLVVMGGRNPGAELQ